MFYVFLLDQKTYIQTYLEIQVNECTPSNVTKKTINLMFWVNDDLPSNLAYRLIIVIGYV